MAKKHWRSITEHGTKTELRFATKTLGRQGIDWEWMKKSPRRWFNQLMPQFTVGILKKEFDRIEKKYRAITSRGKL